MSKRSERRSQGANGDYFGCTRSYSRLYLLRRIPSSRYQLFKHFHGIFAAGVGRTGTLVALDSLMQQLQDENQVSIYNTVYDMRHQRNFLVQSLVRVAIIRRITRLL